jgi:hypothetical protein
MLIWSHTKVHLLNTNIKKANQLTRKAWPTVTQKKSTGERAKQFVQVYMFELNFDVPRITTTAQLVGEPYL